MFSLFGYIEEEGFNSTLSAYVHVRELFVLASCVDTHGRMYSLIRFYKAVLPDISRVADSIDYRLACNSPN